MRTVGFLVLGAVMAGCGRAPVPVADLPPRPVTYMLLEQLDPSTFTRLTGSVESWKKEQLGFRVAGRVSYVIEPGLDITGRHVHRTGKVESEGTVVARVDATRYQVLLDEAKANVQAREAQAEAMRNVIDDALPQQLKQAEADMEQKGAEYKRVSALIKTGAITASEYDKTAAEYRAAQAVRAEIMADKIVKQSQLAALKAEIRQAEQLTNQAQINVDDCHLYSPFRGQISKVHVIPGGFVERGQPVLTVQMMDPIKVQVAVSPETDKRLNYNDLVKVYVEGSDAPVQGWVYLKDTVADAATRTFMVTLLVRNTRVEAGKQEGALPTPHINTLQAWDEPGRWYVDEESVRDDAEGSYVWKLDGLSTADMYGGGGDKTYPIRKVRIKLGERRVPFMQIFTYREVTDLGGLDPKTDVYAGPLPGSAKEGDRVYQLNRRWRLRPGQLVRVDLTPEAHTRGYYVPMQTVRRDNSGYFVNLVQAGEGGRETARRVRVKLGPGFGDFRRIEPVEPGALSDGARMVVDGTHFLEDGEKINAFDQVEFKP